eukprot:TRINITY_DN6276_c0_g1_i1.p1 TRINITY_DN6276_c0_g1~~TRINITY_DN6276_c0_g1_i1.p1  ORF type:complete len:998 (-),score=167.34 TRINITY_DN6276_c0_g1_i1:95-3088(-)
MDSYFHTDGVKDTPEGIRLTEDKVRSKNWKRWGPYLSERQWGTVREDYSENGDCWNYSSHDMSRSKAYRWGEDGILGITDRQCRICFALAMWNNKDPILKERLFGLTSLEGNHGEDVKEEYFYLKSLPTHSYMKGLYKYPQNAYPYSDIVNTNRGRNRNDPEYELMDTGIFNNDEYWDIFTEYAKASPNDILIRITVANRSDKEETIHLLPTLWYRNSWSYNSDYEEATERRRIEVDRHNPAVLVTEHPELGNYKFSCDTIYSDTCEAKKCLIRPVEWIFTENETNNERLYNSSSATKYVKDGFNNYVIHRANTVNPEKYGSKAAAYHILRVPAKSEVTINLRLWDTKEMNPRENFIFGDDFNRIFLRRHHEHDEYYERIIPKELTLEEKEVCIQAFAGLMWSKQFFFYVIKDWLSGDKGFPPPPESRKKGRNSDWLHLFNRDVISMPDKWEYPWYAVWDLAFHMVSIALFDIEFAKDQLLMFLREWYMHPNGCLPAYEFNFGDVNPPVHAWACWRVYKMSGTEGNRDTDFLARVFQKLIINFTWWVNRKDPDGKNLFSGGFLGLDNIGVFDRSQPLSYGALQQADGTSWMAFYCLYMLKMAMELSVKVDPVYEDLASKFFEHFVLIADAMNSITDGKHGLWDDSDGFYYDQLVSNHGGVIPLKVRSLVGLTPLFATGIIPSSQMKKLPGFNKRTHWFLDHRKDLSKQIELLTCTGESQCGSGNNSLFLLSIPLKTRLISLMKYLFDENEFLSKYGFRSLSRYHQDHPYNVTLGNSVHSVSYMGGESQTALFGGNSNWRGPIWTSMNFLLIEALERFHHFYGDELVVEYPTNSGKNINTKSAAVDICRRISELFLPDVSGRRPCHGKNKIFTDNKYWKDYIYFYEHFHGCDGRGLGASHQTGWTALVANCLYKVAEERSKKIKSLKKHAMDIYINNMDHFVPEFWDSVKKEDISSYLKFLEESGEQNLKSMMKTFFDKARYRYVDILIDYAQSISSK